LQIGYSDEFMGPLTAAQTFVAIDAGQLRTAVNLRLPVGREPAVLVEQLRDTLNAWASENAIAMQLDISASDPMYRNPEGAWVNALLDIAVENLNIPREFGSSAGGTSIHDLPNGVQFGLALATEKYTGHNANEFKTVEQFLLDLQIATEMFAKLGTMPELQ
jgi:acetylornithine deacetylase/succinyl-diaminopimelate desuccinylase-like protein